MGRVSFFVAVCALSIGVQAQVGDAVRNGALPGPLPLFPVDNWWNQDISSAPVAPNSAALISFIGTTRQLHPDFGGYESPGSQNIYGFPYIVVSGDHPKVAVQFDYSDESDGVNHTTDTSFPFYPIPPQAITEPYWIEGGPPGSANPGGDRHMLIVDRDNRFLYELFDLSWTGSNWRAGSGAFFDTKTNNRRPDTWTSADAAGLAILPGLVRADEVFGPNEINHALRFTVQSSNGYVWPASHRAGGTNGALPMGARLRLKASVNINARTSYEPARKVFRAMQKYGLIVADNGSNMYISGAFDPNWDNGLLNPAFRSFTANDFEVIELGWRGGGGCAVPAAPGSLSSNVSRQLVQLNWGAPGGQSGYQLEAGSASGLANLATFVLGNTSTFSVTAPVGTYYVRTRALNACGASAPSNEIVVSVTGGCSAPSAPGNLRFTRSGALVSLNWDGVTGAQSYQLEAGSATGLSNFFLGEVSGPITATAPPGTYFVRVRARNTCALGPPSNELVVVL